MDNLLIEKQAIDFRKERNMDGDSIVDFTALLDGLNVVALFKPLKDEFAGMAFKHGDNLRFMMINSRHPRGKQNFTICHELYHLMIQSDFIFMKCQTEIFDRKKDKEEYRADMFASHLLMPTDGLISKIPKEQFKKDKISIETLVRIEQYFQCSRRALLYRLIELQLISDTLKTQYLQGVRASAKSLGYTEDLYVSDNGTRFIGKDYHEGIEELYEKELITQSNYLEMKFDVGEDLY